MSEQAQAEHRLCDQACKDQADGPHCLACRGPWPCLPAQRDVAVLGAPQQLLDALATVASYGAGKTSASFEMEGGATMMIEVTVLDVTGWQEEQ